MAKLQPAALRDLSGGMVSFASDVLIPDNAAKFSMNFHFDVVGKATQRDGTTLLGDVVSSTHDCQGLFQHIAGGTNRLLSVFNGVVYAYNGTTWSSTNTVSSASAKVRFADFIGYAFQVGGGSSPASWDGGSWGSTNLSGAPTTTLLAPYKDRLYLAGNSTYPDRVFFSSIVSLSNTITWNQNTQYFDVNPDDHGNITALAVTSNVLLILKRHATYRWNGSGLFQLEGDAGTTSQESVALSPRGGLAFFFNENGVYMTNGGYNMEVSRPIYDWVKAVDPTYYESVAGFCDADHYYCSVGDITKDGRTFSNVWFVYTLSSKNWGIYSFADSFRVLTRRQAADGTITYVGGDTDGAVQTLFSGTTDNGAAIAYEHRSKRFEFGSRATTKEIKRMATFTEPAVGATFSIDADGRGFKTVGQAKNPVSFIDSVNVGGRGLTFKMMGTNKGTPVVYEGFELIDWENDGYVNATK